MTLLGVHVMVVTTVLVPRRRANRTLVWNGTLSLPVLTQIVLKAQCIRGVEMATRPVPMARVHPVDVVLTA